MWAANSSRVRTPSSSMSPLCETRSPDHAVEIGDYQIAVMFCGGAHEQLCGVRRDPVIAVNAAVQVISGIVDRYDNAYC